MFSNDCSTETVQYHISNFLCIYPKTVEVTFYNDYSDNFNKISSLIHQISNQQVHKCFMKIFLIKEIV